MEVEYCVFIVLWDLVEDVDCEVVWEVVWLPLTATEESNPQRLTGPLPRHTGVLLVFAGQSALRTAANELR